jgi:putative molybdopterin biosynthesis protein
VAPRHRVLNNVRSWRERLGLSQEQLAAQVRTSRQTLGAIEAGRTVPSTALALRFAAELGGRVEDLFRLPGSEEEVTAHLVGSPLPETSRLRVSLSLVGRRVVAVPLIGPLASLASLPEADGVVTSARGDTVRVRLLTSVDRLADTVIVSGCDPALPIVAAHMHRAHPRYSLAWLPAGSLQALRWLRAGAAHVAGLHIRDLRTGQENVPVARRILGRTSATVLEFATWEQGLIVASGNRRGIHGVADLARRDLTFINRERGSGARALLEGELARAGISPSQVRGYAREASSHLAVAQAVALGLVDCGIGIRAAARAYRATFLPLQRERYDLVVPTALLQRPAVQAFLETAGSPAVRKDLEALGDYDTGRLGTTVAVLP